MRRTFENIVMAACIFATGAACYDIGWSRGVRLRACPAQLEDGRQLLSHHLADDSCHYFPAPPLTQTHSPAELRRIASSRERMERVGSGEKLVVVRPTDLMKRVEYTR